jgi:hypothetical protein
MNFQRLDPIDVSIEKSQEFRDQIKNRQFK